MKNLLRIIIFCLFSLVSNSQNLPDWDIAAARFSKDSGNYILVYHRSNCVNFNFPKNTFTSTWDAKTGRLINYNFDETYRCLLPDGRILEGYFDSSDTVTFQNHPRLCPPVDNGTCMIVEEDRIKVFDKYSNAIKFEIHPADAYPLFDFTSTTQEIKDYAEKLVQQQKESGFSLVLRMDTLFASDKQELFFTPQKNKTGFTYEGDYNIFIIAAADKHLTIGSEIIKDENRFFKYINYSDGNNGNISHRIESWAGAAAKINISFQYFYSKAKMPVTILLFKNQDGPVTASWKKEIADSLAIVNAEKNRISAEKKAFAPVLALAKSKMQTGEKIVLDTLVWLEDKIYDNSFFKVETKFDVQNNRTIYAAVRKCNEFLKVTPDIIGAYRELPTESIKQITNRDIKITNISFTGPVEDFELHNMNDTALYAYIVVTTRKDPKGYAANKQQLDEWEAGDAAERQQWDEAMSRNFSASGDFSSMAKTIKNYLEDIYNETKNVDRNIRNTSNPTRKQLAEYTMPLVDKYDVYREFIVANESKIKSYNAKGIERYSGYLTGLAEISVNLATTMKRISAMLDNAKTSGESIYFLDYLKQVSDIKDYAEEGLKLSWD
jgi:hypothetical protein